MNAGTTIHAVELITRTIAILCVPSSSNPLGISKKAFHANAQNATIAEMEKTVSVSLLPDIARNIDTVLGYMHPITEKHGFMAEMKLGEITEDMDKRVVRQVLKRRGRISACSAGRDGSHYFIHRDLYQTLARLRARTLFTSASYGLTTEDTSSGRFGGSLNTERHALEHRPSSRAMKASLSGLSTPPAAATEADRKVVRDRLLMAVGLAPSDYTDLIRSGALPHANALATLLQRLSQQQLIGVHIDDELNEMKEELQRAAAAIRHEQYAAGLVDTVSADLEAVVPALLLRQGGRYQETLIRLIDSLERANGEDQWTGASNSCSSA